MTIMGDDLDPIRLADYKPTSLRIQCRRCQRNASLSRHSLQTRYGNPTLGELARLVAADGERPCNVANAIGGPCEARPDEPPVDHWATLADALYGGWECRFYCERRHAGLKASKSCPGPIRLDVRSLVTALGFDQKLYTLYRKVRCPGCASEAFSIRWRVPSPAKA
ncbi:MAG: hypothetical protein ABL866_12785 [Devosia sp.]